MTTNINLNLNYTTKLYTVGILRDEGSNGEKELASVFYHSGFNVIDINMYDLINNKINSVAKIYNIGNNNPVGLIEFINLIEENLGKKAKMSMQPLQLGDAVETYADITSIQAEFNFVPSTPLTKGIPLFIKWYREYHNL